MSVRTFFGGIHPNYAKELTAASPIEVLSAPETVVVPMLQHIGAPAVPTVKKGDEVLAGQVIGEAPQPISAPVHAPISGTVVAVTDRPHINGRSVLLLLSKTMARTSGLNLRVIPIRFSWIAILFWTRSGPRELLAWVEPGFLPRQN